MVIVKTIQSLKSEVGKLDIDKLEKVRSCLKNLKSKEDKLDVGKLPPASTDVYDEFVKKVSDTDASGRATKIDGNAKIKDIEDKVPIITGLATTTALNAIENKIPSDSALVKKIKD